MSPGPNISQVNDLFKGGGEETDGKGRVAVEPKKFMSQDCPVKEETGSIVSFIE